MRKVILSADSTCDLGDALKERYNVHYFYNKIQLDGKTYTDILEITPEDIYDTWRQKGKLPTTSAVMPADYHEYFHKWVAEGYDVVHLSLGSGISGGYQNCCLTAKELGHIYPIDTQNLSSGFGCLVLRAAQLIEEGCPATEVQQRITAITHLAHTSFLLDTLEFMKEGGRCSAVSAFGANLLRLKPCIEVDNQNGSKMGVGKKYRGKMERCLPLYVRDKLEGRENIDLSRVFITHSGSPDSDIELVKGEIKKYADFQEVHVTRTNSTISSHCGPRTLGVVFMTTDKG